MHLAPVVLVSLSLDVPLRDKRPSTTTVIVGRLTASVPARVEAPEAPTDRNTITVLGHAQVDRIERQLDLLG